MRGAQRTLPGHTSKGARDDITSCLHFRISAADKFKGLSKFICITERQKTNFLINIGRQLMRANIQSLEAINKISILRAKLITCLDRLLARGLFNELL